MLGRWNDAGEASPSNMRSTEFRAAVDITNPQTWNRYAYVGNNPLSNVDPLGLDHWEVSGNCMFHFTSWSWTDSDGNVHISVEQDGQSFCLNLGNGTGRSSGWLTGFAGGGGGDGSRQTQPKPSSPSGSPGKLQQLVNWYSQVNANFVRWSQRSTMGRVARPTTPRVPHSSRVCLGGGFCVL